MNDLALSRPSLGSIAALAVNAQNNPNTARAYGSAIQRYLEWHATQDEPFSRRTVTSYLRTIESTSASNQALAALRSLAREAYANGMIPDTVAYGITSIKGIRSTGKKSGNWLDQPGVVRLLQAAEKPRDLAILHLLTFGALRREEVAGLQCEQLTQREGRWVLLDVKRKRNRVQTVPLLETTAKVLQAYIGKKTGPMFDITSRRMYNIVRDLALRAGIENLGCHDLRRTGAAMMRRAGAPLEKIQAHLGHKSILTTTIYLQDVDALANSAVDYLPLVGDNT